MSKKDEKQVDLSLRPVSYTHLVVIGGDLADERINAFSADFAEE